MTDDDEILRARKKAMDLLARREHTKLELSTKLATRGFGGEVIDDVLTTLGNDGLISESRFAEAYVSARCRRGIGPVRLRAELRQRGVAGSIIDNALADPDIDWGEMALQVRHKKFGDSRPVDLPDRARQMRFLEYRGFDGDQIRAALDH